MPSALADEFAFGRFRVDAAARRVWADGAAAHLTGRAFDLLLALAARRDRTVPQRELIDVVWGRTVVEESNLSVHVAALRKLFGAEVIATIPGRGYRFTAPLLGAGGGGMASAGARDAERIQAPAPHSAPGNLPAELPPLYGRDDELCQLETLLTRHRLVTLAGAGGIGKTRLALAAAQAAGAGGAAPWWVELASMADPAPGPDAGAVASAVAAALGLSLRAGPQPVEEQLAAALAGRRLLLVLDNCEHLLDAAARLARALLDRAAGIRLLATSRQPLGLADEHVLRLATLSLPAAPMVEPAQALDHGAVRLYVERVRLLEPRFALSADNAAAVIETCRRLDGLPLAIELAAARVPALGVLGVLERLDPHLLKLLGSSAPGSPHAPARHRTLRAALDWSCGLLDATEQRVLRRLAVFAGGCTLEAAQAVCTDAPGPGPGLHPGQHTGLLDPGLDTGPLDAWQVLDTVAALIDKSLVVAEGDERPRYRLLESTRRYALEQLDPRGETAEGPALARRHAHWLAQHFARLSDALYAGQLTEDAFVAARAQELDNLRAALAWALGSAGEPGDAADAILALNLLAHAAPLALLMPSYQECESWTRRLGARLAAGPALSDHERATHTYVQIHWGVQQLRLASEAWAIDAGAQSLRALGDPRREAFALCALAVHALWRGDLAGAQAALDDATRHGSQGWPGWLQAQHLEMRLRLMQGAANPDADTHVARVLAQLQAEGDAEGRAAFALRTRQGAMLVQRGRHEEAVQCLAPLAELGRRQRRDAYRMCFLLGPLARALIELGRLDEARAVALEALPLLQHTGMRADHAPDLALLAARRGRFEAAAQMLGAGDAWLAQAGGRRSALELNSRERVLAMVHAALPDEQVQAALARGATLGSEGFARVAGESL